MNIDKIKFVGGKKASEIIGVHQRTLYLWEKKSLIENFLFKSNPSNLKLWRLVTGNFTFRNAGILELLLGNLEREFELLHLSIDEIAERHQRTPNAIMYKLHHEGIADYNDVFQNRQQKLKVEEQVDASVSEYEEEQEDEKQEDEEQEEQKDQFGDDYDVL